MNLPYGIVNFATLRREGHFYADKTRFLPLLETRRHVLFLRPRRFGKTTLLSMLEHYYDVARADQFDALFSGLHAGAQPTPLRNHYLVLKLDFSGLGLDQGVDALRDAVLVMLKGRMESFFEHYAKVLPNYLDRWLSMVEDAATPAQAMGLFLDYLRKAPHPLYILIDEYDKLVNDLIARGDHETYHQVLAASGFLRMFYERIKIGMEAVVDRVFMTGVTPVMLNDMASGFNVIKNISLHDEYHDLCGLSQAEVESLVHARLALGAYTVPPAQILADLRRYYNGYRFSRRRDARVYNPDAVINFLSDLQPPDVYPTELLDTNLRTDHQKLYTLLFTADRQPRRRPIEIVRALLTEGSILGSLHDLFPLRQAYDERFFPSYLYFLGLVTIAGVEQEELRLAIPNATILEMHGAIFSYILEEAAEIRVDEPDLHRGIRAMATEGRLGPFLDLIDSRVLQRLSNRDLIRLDERGLKMLMLSYLSLSEVFLAVSEQELARGYSDLILMPGRRHGARYGFLIELKYVKDEGRADRALRAAAEVCFTEAEEQLRRYLEDPRLAQVAGPEGWKAYAVVQVGTRAMLYRELGGETITLRWDAARPHRKKRAPAQTKTKTKTKAKARAAAPRRKP